MKLRMGIALIAAGWLVTGAVRAEDLEGCKDHPLFNRMPGHHLVSCESSQFDLREFPVGTATVSADDTLLKDYVQVEGPTTTLVYALDEGATAASGLQIRRNYQNAVKAAGGSVEGEWPGWCKWSYRQDHIPIGNSCMNDGTTLKLTKGGKEYWAFVQGEDGGYAMIISERAAMKQDIAVNELVDKLNKDGFIALYVNFDTGKATIKPDSNKTLDDAAAALKAAPSLKIEVGGHTDNVGAPDANQKLSEARAQAVMAALVARGVEAARLTAKGYGQSAPVADNRSEDGRAKNRRVELVKR